MKELPAGKMKAGALSRAFATVLVATALGFSPARAGDAGAARAAIACGPASGDGASRIASVTDSFDIRLDDGRVLRLAGLDLFRSSVATADAAADVRRALEDWAGAGPVTVHALAATPDRWGRLPALLFSADAAGSSAAITLLDKGLARARPEAAVHPCFAAFLDAEGRARAAKRGLWAGPQAGVLRADDAGGLAGASGGFAIVEGVLSVRPARGGTLYLALGRDRWGFAAVLTRRDATRFGKEGFEVKDYAGTPVRLRGDLDDRFGARIRLTDPDQLESLEPGALDALSR